MKKGEYYLKYAEQCVRMKKVWMKSLNTENHDVAVIEIKKWQQQLEAIIFDGIKKIKIRDGAISWNIKIS